MTFRVVYLDHVARISGGEIALARTLDALGDRIDGHVILGEHGPLVDRLREAGVSVEVVPMPEAPREVRRGDVRPGALGVTALRDTARYVRTLRRRLRELRPDLIHTNSLKAALYGGVAGRLAGIPVIWHIRDRITPDYLPRPAVGMVRVASRLLPTVVIANSHATLETLPEPRRAGVTNAVVYDPIRIAAPRSVSDESPFRVGTVGRLAAWKGQDLFLKAFARAFPDGDTEAWVVGQAMFGDDEPYAHTLPEQAKHLGIAERVVFRGFRENVWDELAQIQVLVHCSVTPEPFGQVVVEGMAAGVPVIAADAGGPAEIITDGVNGLLTAPGDVEALTTAVRRVHNDRALRRRLVSGGLARAEDFSPERTAKALLAVYESVVAARG